MASTDIIYLSTINGLEENGNITIQPNGTGQILLLANPTSATSAVTKSYADSLVASPNLSVSTASASTYNILTSDSIISCSYSTTGIQILTLPTVASVYALTTSYGKIYHVVDSAGNAGTNNIIINCNAADNICGSSYAVINGNYTNLKIYADSANKWCVL
jgi:hypothetical protein